MVKIDRVKKRITVDYEHSEICLFDDGYKCLIFLPNNEKWCVSAVYNTSDEIIEWYFDMTKQYSVDGHGNPFFDDLYLDIAVAPDFKVVILDEDELHEALVAGLITKLDYEMAYKTCDNIIKEIIPDRDFLITLFQKYLTLMEH